MANWSRDSASWARTNGFVMVSAKFVRVMPGEMIVTRSSSPASWRRPSEMARTANLDDAEAGRRRGVHEVAAALLAEHGHGGRDAMEDALDVDVHHGVPLVDPQVVQRGDGHDARVADQHVQPVEPLAAAEAARRLAADLRAAVAPTEDPREQLAETARAYVRFVVQHRAGLDLIFDERLRVGDPTLAEASWTCCSR